MFVFTKNTRQKLSRYNSKIAKFKPIYPGKDFPIYEGPIDRSKMSNLARYGYESFNGQKTKCRNTKNRWYPSYGGKGIEVKYSVREFIGWYLHCRRRFKGKTATVGRIDHDKHYCFENILMLDSAENSREAMTRNMRKLSRHLITPVIAYDAASKKEVARFESIRHAAYSLGASQRLIQFNVRKKYSKLGLGLNLILRVEGDFDGVCKPLRYRKERGEQSSCS